MIKYGTFIQVRVYDQRAVEETRKSRFNFCKNPQISTLLTGKVCYIFKNIPPSRYYFAPEAVLLQKYFAPGQGS